MNAGRLGSLLFLTGLGVLLAALLGDLPFGAAPMVTGQGILAGAAEATGAANQVTSVVLAYRGFDTLGELTILFTAAIAAGMILGERHGESDLATAGFVLRVSADLLFPFLLLLGVYIILHGHLTPGGGFQGGAIIAVAFFLPLLAQPARRFHAHGFAMLEGLAGVAFLAIGLAGLLQRGDFLAPLLGRGNLGELFSAGSLPLLYLAVGIKVGSELAGLLHRMLHAEGPAHE